MNDFPIHYFYNHVKHHMVSYRFLCMVSFSDVPFIAVIYSIIVLMALGHKDKRTKALRVRRGFTSESAEAKNKKIS